MRTGVETIRLAGMQDLEALCRLYYDFHEFHVRGVPDRLVNLGDGEAFDDSQLRAALEKIVADDDGALFVAEAGNQIVGLAEVYVRQDEPHPERVSRRYGYLQSLMVHESFRRQGIGRRLAEVAQEWAGEKGATEMRLDTWEFPASPLGFYECLGYRTLRRTLVQEL
ncbi:MAG: GNAT family N-acetyltransferase [Anaerolineae bacterium]|nr:MAG: GNAT family N-acetyltransferase [Anaerolineae bacterium]